jgi:O-antigen/teichoic acid export membrane protein
MAFVALSYEPHWIFLMLGIISARFLSIFTNSFLLKSYAKTHNHIEETQVVLTKKEIVKQMKPIMMMGILGWISGFADRYIIAGALNVIQTGYYSVSTGLVGRPYNVISGALTVYFKREGILHGRYNSKTN